MSKETMFTSTHQSRLLLDAPLSLAAVIGLFAAGCLLIMLWARSMQPHHLVLGFATTAVLWFLAYIAMLAPGLAVGEALFALMLAVLFMGGFVAGKMGVDDTGRAITPWKVGLVSAIANLLVLGAFLRDEKGGSQFTPLIYVVGLFATSMLLAWMGGMVARKRSTPSKPAPRAVGLFAIVAAGTVFLMLITGGLVTSYESGLAVPDWPNSFGHNMLLYPISEMKGGIFWEHAHRLYGMLVGATMLVFFIVLLRGEQRRWIQLLGAIALLCVIVQGVLGGLRVTGNFTNAVDGATLAPSIFLAIVHGTFGQIVFALLAVIAVATSKRFAEMIPRVRVGAALDRTFTVALCVMTVLQIALGACYRHLTIPPIGDVKGSTPAWAMHSHLSFGVLLAAFGILIAVRAIGLSDGVKPVRAMGKALMMLFILQVCLGLGALVTIMMRKDGNIPALEVILTTSHQVTGALVLAHAAMLATWTRRAFLSDAGVGGVPIIPIAN